MSKKEQKKIPKIDRVMTDTSEKSDFSSAIAPLYSSIKVNPGITLSFRERMLTCRVSL